MDHYDVFSQVISRFSNGKAAQVLLRMPGCREVFVNSVHQRAFPYTAFEIANSKSDARRFSEHERRVGPNFNFETDRPCYCYPLDALIALRKDHCVFERSFDELSGQKQKFIADVAAFKVSQNEHRVYQLYSATSHLVESGDPGYLAVSYAKLCGFQISVKTTKMGKNGAAVELDGNVSLNGNDFLSLKNSEIDKIDDYQAVYELFDSEFIELERQSRLKGGSELVCLQKSRERLQLSIDNCQTPIDRPAVRGYLNGVYGSAAPALKAVLKSIQSVTNELARVQACLFDAIVVAPLACSVFDKTKNWQKLSA